MSDDTLVLDRFCKSCRKMLIEDDGSVRNPGLIAWPNGQIECLTGCKWYLPTLPLLAAAAYVTGQVVMETCRPDRPDQRRPVPIYRVENVDKDFPPENVPCPVCRLPMRVDTIEHGFDEFHRRIIFYCDHAAIKKADSRDVEED